MKQKYSTTVLINKFITKQLKKAMFIHGFKFQFKKYLFNLQNEWIIIYIVHVNIINPALIYRIKNKSYKNTQAMLCKGTYHRQLVNSSPKITVRHEEACKSSTNIIYQWNVGFVATKLINV